MGHGVSVSCPATSGNAMLPSRVTMPVHDTKQNAPHSGRCSYMRRRGMPHSGGITRTTNYHYKLRTRPYAFSVTLYSRRRPRARRICSSSAGTR